MQSFRMSRGLAGDPQRVQGWNGEDGRAVLRHDCTGTHRVKSGSNWTKNSTARRLRGSVQWVQGTIQF